LFNSVIKYGFQMVVVVATRSAIRCVIEKAVIVHFNHCCKLALLDCRRQMAVRSVGVGGCQFVQLIFKDWKVFGSFLQI